MNNKFKIIRGGLSDSYNTSRRVFQSSYITDTRLMGVVGMYIHWQLPENLTIKDFHQFFYFDAEEFGFDTYKSLLGNDQKAFDEIENSLIGGLGGDKIPLSLEEALYTVQHYAKMNQSQNLEFPDKREEYEFLINESISLPEEEIHNLMCKQTVPIKSSYQLINYFMMRVFGKDLEAASFLSTKNFDFNLFPDFKAATFYKNNIRKTSNAGVYGCDSLVEFDDVYYIVVTSITVNDKLISGFKRISTMKISPQEAAMQLMRSEFISVFEITDTSLVSRNMSKLSKTSMINTHENGSLYMIFNPNNEHVTRKNYRLNEDVLGMYYISDTNQFIAAAYSMNEIKILEKDLADSVLADKLIPISKYEFIEPVLYEFIQSGFEDFELFVEAIKK